MNVKRHYSGLCIAYEPMSNPGGERKKLLFPSSNSKSNTSRINRQKRAIHDATEWMRLNSHYRPLIFCLTVPVQSDWKLQNSNVSKFCENLKKTYDAKDYLWVREYTGAGRPHYHFVSDCPMLPAVDLSHYWSGLFGSDSANSIRLGTAPGKTGKRQMFVNSPRMSRYLTKYMGKAIGEEENRGGGNRKIRTFGHSLNCWKQSRPITYESTYTYREKIKAQIMVPCRKTFTLVPQEVEIGTKIHREFKLCENSEGELMEVYGNVPEDLKEFDNTEYSWFNPNELHRVYYGFMKKSIRARKTQIKGY